MTYAAIYSSDEEGPLSRGGFASEKEAWAYASENSTPDVLQVEAEWLVRAEEELDEYEIY